MFHVFIVQYSSYVTNDVIITLCFLVTHIGRYMKHTSQCYKGIYQRLRKLINGSHYLFINTHLF